MDQLPNSPVTSTVSEPQHQSVTTSPNSLRKRRVLIIDDDIYTCEMYATNLRAAGYDVVIADNGITGYDKLSHEPFDVVLLDIMLPQLQGDDVLKKWRRTSPKGSKPPIIILTNYEQDETTRAALIRNADNYIVKASITPRDLRAIIAKAINI